MPIIDADELTHAIDELWTPLRRPARILRRTVADAIDDDIGGEAAKCAYFFFLSLFPLTLIVFALTGFLGGNAAFERITRAVESATPDYAWQFIQELIGEITQRRRPGALSVGIILALWAASNGISTLTHGLDRMYDVVDSRSWVQRRLLSLAVLAVGVVLLVALAAAVVPALAAGLGLDDRWRQLRWPLAFVATTAVTWLAYRYLPARDQRGVWRETLIGAVTGTALWLMGTLAFSLYVSNFSRYGRLYGALGAVIVLLLWFYLTGIAILGGGELARVLEEEGRDTVDERREAPAQSNGATVRASRS